MQLGDWVAEKTKKAGITPCIPCQARQQKMNTFHQNVANIVKKVKDAFSPGSSS